MASKIDICPPGVIECDHLETDKPLPDVVVNIINGALALIGLVCVIMIIKGGIQYMEATGDPGKVKIAKSTILYSVIGLAVCVLAFAIVNFVLGAIK